MTKIKRLEVYPLKKTPSKSDYIIGTDSENFGRTVSFSLSDFMNDPSEEISLEGYNEVGSSEGGDLIVTLGNDSQKIIIDTQNQNVSNPTGGAFYSQSGFVFGNPESGFKSSLVSPSLSSDVLITFPAKTGTLATLDDLGDSTLSLTSTIAVSTDALAAHVGGMNEVTSASDIVVTLQENATEDIPLNSILTYLQQSTGKITLQTAGSVTVSNSNAQTYKEGDVLTLWQQTLDNWVVLNSPHAIDSDIDDEITGSDQVNNIVSLTQAEYDAGTPVSTTAYIITT